jgi:hypothetical protein
MGQTAFVDHHALPQEFQIDEEELRWLEGEGLVETSLVGSDGEAIRVTTSGHQRAEALRALGSDEEPEAGTAIRLDWADVALPTLEAAHLAWTSRGAPAGGVPIAAVARALNRDEHDREMYRAVALLAERGYLGAPSGVWTNDAPAFVTVTPDGLELVGGWPATSAEARRALC